MKHYGILKRRCDLIVAMDEQLQYELDECIYYDCWLTCGPPDGIIQEYTNCLSKGQDIKETELYLYCQEDDTFKEWVDEFKKLFDYLVEEDFDLGVD